MGIIKDLTGRVFGRLTVIDLLDKRDNFGRTVWLCRCSCGKQCNVTGFNLSSGHTTSCGCAKADSPKVIAANKAKRIWATPLEASLAHRFSNILYRCNTETAQMYPDYGARGVQVSGAWANARTGRRSFVDWCLANGVTHGVSIDRVNAGKYHEFQNGPYSPDNCRPADFVTQNNNTRANIYITSEGITKTLSQWDRELGCKPGQLKSYYRRHGLDETAFIILNYRDLTNHGVNILGR